MDEIRYSRFLGDFFRFSQNTHFFAKKSEKFASRRRAKILKNGPLRAEFWLNKIKHRKSPKKSENLSKRSKKSGPKADFWGQGQKYGIYFRKFQKMDKI